MQICFDGGFPNAGEKLLSIQDPGLCFADALFEVIRCVGGKLLLNSKHIQRMKESTAFLRMEFPHLKDELLLACKELSKRYEILD